jgi:hypothetical protein
VPLRPELVVEVSYDQVTGQRFRHGTTFVRWRPDKAPRQCTMEQLAHELHPAVLAQFLEPADYPGSSINSISCPCGLLSTAICTPPASNTSWIFSALHIRARSLLA